MEKYRKPLIPEEEIEPIFDDSDDAYTIERLNEIDPTVLEEKARKQQLIDDEIAASKARKKLRNMFTKNSQKDLSFDN